MRIIKYCIPYISNLLFGVSARIYLGEDQSFEDYLQHFKSKKRRDLKRIYKKEYVKYRIVSRPFRLQYAAYLFTFLRTKYRGQPHWVFFYWTLSLLLFSLNILHFVEYQDKATGAVCGWSSYFILHDTYYDFISSPNNMPISIIGLHSILFCLQSENKHIRILDMGPTLLTLKVQKFGCVQYDILNDVYF